MRCTATTGTTSVCATLPDHAGAHVLRRSQAATRRSMSALHQHRLRRRIDARGDERDGGASRASSPLGSSTSSGSPRLSDADALERHVHVHFERRVLIDRRQHVGGRHAVADAHRHVADDAGDGGDDVEVLELDAGFAGLRLHRRGLGLEALDPRLGLVELLLADGAALEQRRGCARARCGRGPGRPRRAVAVRFLARDRRPAGAGRRSAGAARRRARACPRSRRCG